MEKCEVCQKENGKLIQHYIIASGKYKLTCVDCIEKEEKLGEI